MIEEMERPPWLASVEQVASCLEEASFLEASSLEAVMASSLAVTQATCLVVASLFVVVGRKPL